MAKIIIIAAIGKNRELGKNNDLIWRFKEDMKFFKENTIGHKIVMGYNTFKSLPGLLSDRCHIVLTHQDLKIEGVEVFNDFESLVNYLKSINEDIYVIGGASIYKLFIDIADELILTEIEAEDEHADVYFPEFNQEDFDRSVVRDNEGNGIKFNFVRYRRVK